MMKAILFILDLQTYIFHLRAQCIGPLSIVLPTESIVEDMISHILLEQFECVLINEVRAHCASPLDCSVQVFATCMDIHDEWPFHQEFVEAILEERIGCVLTEFFDTIHIDYISLNMYE